MKIEWEICQKSKCKRFRAAKRKRDAPRCAEVKDGSVHWLDAEVPETCKFLAEQAVCQDKVYIDETFCKQMKCEHISPERPFGEFRCMLNVITIVQRDKRQEMIKHYDPKLSRELAKLLPKGCPYQLEIMIKQGIKNEDQ